MTDITTTGELRSLLVKMIADVESDKSNTNRVNDVATLATKVNDSMACEARILEIQKSLGNQTSEIGDLKLVINE